MIRILKNLTTSQNLGRTPRIMSASISDFQKKNQEAESLLKSLEAEIECIQKELAARRKVELEAENVVLRKQIEAAKRNLISLETLNGRKQISLPPVRNFSTDAPTVPPVKTEEPPVTPAPTTDSAKPQKEKKEKVKKEKAPAPAIEEPPIDVGRLDLRVGKIVEVSRHPDADSLYLEKIDCGEPNPRTVISGLVKFVPIEEMKNRMVVVLCNLKPAKMRGILSEAMVMCASTPEKVEVLSPPAGSAPGDHVHCEGYERNPDAQLNPKKKVFETCAPDLKTNDSLIACFKGAALNVPGKGNVVAQSLKNVFVK
ncbi:AIMP1 family protein [Megaselia abdita]